MKKVTRVKPVSTTLLVEILSAKEIMGTFLHVNDDSKSVVTPQARVLDWGNLFDAEKYGVKVGSRLLIQGTYIPAPKTDPNNNHELGIIEFNAVKAVLEESED